MCACVCVHVFITLVPLKWPLLYVAYFVAGLMGQLLDCFKFIQSTGDLSEWSYFNV